MKYYSSNFDKFEIIFLTALERKMKPNLIKKLNKFCFDIFNILIRTIIINAPGIVSIGWILYNSFTDDIKRLAKANNYLRELKTQVKEK